MPQLLSRLYTRIKSIPRRYVYEIIATIGSLLAVAIAVSLFSPYDTPKQYAFAEQDTSATVIRATIVTTASNSIDVKINDGPSKGLTITVPLENMDELKGINPGSDILITESSSTNSLIFLDLYRIPLLIFIISLFIVTVLIVGRRKGLMSLAGLGASIIVIGWVIIPLIIDGYNSLFVSVFGAFVIAIVSILIAHGFQKRTYVSLLCVLIVLSFVTAGSILAVTLLGLTGIVDDAGYYLQLDHPTIDLSGILIGGIVIAALGALDDIVTTQVATVDELKKANTTLEKKVLYKKAWSVGAEHIAALVNTLALVYVGAALPLIVAYTISTPDSVLLLNSEFVATEIARIVIVSIGLVIAVPISTYVAASIFHKNS